MMEFIKSLITIDNAMKLGVPLIIVGVIICCTPIIGGGNFAVYDKARQVLKKETQQLGQDERYDRLVAEENSISKIPAYGKAIIAAGIIITAVSWVLGRIM